MLPDRGEGVAQCHAHDGDAQQDLRAGVEGGLVADDVGQVQHASDCRPQNHTRDERDQGFGYGPAVNARRQGDDHHPERTDGGEQQVKCGQRPSWLGRITRTIGTASSLCIRLPHVGGAGLQE